MDKHSAQIRWQCQRGMLELDLLLMSYFDQAYLSASEEEKELFARLLKCHDQDLLQWFVEQKQPDDPALGKMIQHIKNYYRGEHV